MSEDPGPAIAVGVLGLVILAAATMWAGAEVAHLVASAARPPANPFALVFAVASGRFRWSGVATGVAAVIGAATATLAGWVAVRVRRGKVRGTHIDGRARRLVGDRHGLRRYTDPSAAPVASQVGPGPQIGRIVNG